MKNAANSARWAWPARGPHRAAVTLIELLFVMMILVILVAAAFGAYTGAVAQARIERTRAIIARLDLLITEKYESYKTRAVPIRVLAGTRPVGDSYQDTAADNTLTNGMYDNGETIVAPSTAPYEYGAAEYRLYALRELMRLEMPCVKADVVVGPVQQSYFPGPVPPGYGLQFLSARPALNRNYLKRACNIPGGLAAWTEPYEGAECLYLIVSSMRDGEDSALSSFAPSEIGDFDGDGMLEFHDAFGNPIEFVRWPAGYSEHPGPLSTSPNGEWGAAGVDDDSDGIDDNPSEAGWPGSDDILPPPTPQTRNFKKAPDPFDPLKVDGRYRLPNNFITPFALYPLVYSPGPDEEYDIVAFGFNRHQGGQFDGLPIATSRELLDPYRVEFTGTPARRSNGSPYDPDGVAGFADNITNHDFSEK